MKNILWIVITEFVIYDCERDCNVTISYLLISLLCTLFTSNQMQTTTKNQKHCIFRKKRCSVSFISHRFIQNVTKYLQHCESRWLKYQALAFKLRISTKYYYDYVVHTYNSKTEMFSYTSPVSSPYHFIVAKCKMLHLLQRRYVFCIHRYVHA